MSAAKAGRSTAKLFRFLTAKWPLAFNLGAPKPLKIGIYDDMRKADGSLSEDELKRALRAYTKMERYLATLRNGVDRVDLDGNPAGCVTPADAATAETLLRTRKVRKAEAQLQKAEPKVLSNREVRQTSGAKVMAGRLAGVVVETRRRRIFRKPQI